MIIRNEAQFNRMNKNMSGNFYQLKEMKPVSKVNLLLYKANAQY